MPVKDNFKFPIKENINTSDEDDPEVILQAAIAQLSRINSELDLPQAARQFSPKPKVTKSLPLQDLPAPKFFSNEASYLTNAISRDQTPRRKKVNHTLPRTSGSRAFVDSHFSPIRVAMTFSDAEDDHPATNSSSRSNQPPRRGESSDSGVQDSTSQSRTESGLSNVSTPPVEASNGTPPSSLPSGSLRSAFAPTRVSRVAASSVSPAAVAAVSASNSVHRLVNDQLVDSEKLVDKLKQIQGYISQTSTAMEALEKEGDMSKINQYKTLVKVMKDLRASESTLQQKIESKSGSQRVEKMRVDNPDESSLDESSRPLSQISTARLESAAASQVVASSGSEAASSQSGDPPKLSMHERLQSAQEESELITAKMRETIGKREELMSRYKSTRERLSNLKKQRKDLLQDERRILQNSGAPSEVPYEDPIPGAEAWPLDQLEKSLEEFRSLYDKVDQLQSAYHAKIEALEPEEESERNDMANKMEQLVVKRHQLISAITQLKQLRRTKRIEQGLPENDEGDDVPTSEVRTESDSQPAPPPQVKSEPEQDAQESQSDQEDMNLDIGGIHGGALVTRNKELAAQHQQLTSLKGQLDTMKKLLEVAKADRMREEKKMLERKAEMERRIAEQHSAEGGAVSEEMEGVRVTGLAGNSVTLSPEELQNPEVMSKYKLDTEDSGIDLQCRSTTRKRKLAEAKNRLNKMEEVMTMIAEARRNGQSIQEALPPEYLAILEDAKQDLGEDDEQEDQEPPVQPRPVVRDPVQPRPIVRDPVQPRSTSKASLHPPSQPIRPPSQPRNIAQLDVPQTMGAMRPERSSSRPKESKTKEISTMERNLNKRPSRISAINERSKGHEKGAIKKQPQNLFQGDDPRVAEALKLQEELREKKNAFEALVRGMGKSSSFNSDNISDNISDNVSEASDRMEISAATWGIQDYSDRHPRSSDDDQADEDDEPEIQQVYHTQRSQRRYNSSTHRMSLPPKDRNRHIDPRLHLSERPSSVAVNNLAVPTRPKQKQNRLRGSSVPNTSWERAVVNPRDANFKSTSNNTLQTQNALNTAMIQLSQVQETINNICGSSSQDGSVHTQRGLMPNVSIPQNYFSHLPTPSPIVGPSLNSYGGLGSYVHPGFAGQQGLGAVDPSTQPPPTLVPMLQQCFSQLHLHSLEIQALSKHIQLLEQRDQEPTTERPIHRERTRSPNERNSRKSRGRKNDDEGNDYDPNLLPKHARRQESHTNFRRYRHPTDQPSPTVNNPFYSHLSEELQAVARSYPIPETDRNQSVQEYETSIVRDLNQEIDFIHAPQQQEMQDSRSQVPAEDQLDWNDRNLSTDILQSPSTGVLNNQVAPGTRANNYWDNFRSYSRQNLLSTTRKRNTSENLASTLLPEVTSQQSPSAYQGDSHRGNNKHFNLNNQTPVSGGARAKSSSSLHILSNSGVRNPVTSSPTTTRRNPDKSNKRHLQGQTQDLPSTLDMASDRGRHYNNFISKLQRNESSPLVEQNVVNEAEFLMKKQSKHPEFLLNLFREASSITKHTDQQVAIDLLRGLAENRARSPSNRYQNDIHSSNKSQIDHRRSPLTLQHCPPYTQNHPIAVEGFIGVSGSDISDNPNSSEENIARALGSNVKNQDARIFSPFLIQPSHLQSAHNTSRLLTPSTLTAPPREHPRIPVASPISSKNDKGAVLRNFEGTIKSEPRIKSQDKNKIQDNEAEQEFWEMGPHTDINKTGQCLENDAQKGLEILTSNLVDSVSMVFQACRLENIKKLDSTISADLLTNVLEFLQNELSGNFNSPSFISLFICDLGNFLNQFMGKEILWVQINLGEMLSECVLKYQSLISLNKLWVLANGVQHDPRGLPTKSTSEVVKNLEIQMNLQRDGLLSNPNDLLLNPIQSPNLDGVQGAAAVLSHEQENQNIRDICDLEENLNKFGAEFNSDNTDEHSESDIFEPLLPVHDLAEADQSHDLNNGEWEDPGVEGLSEVAINLNDMDSQLVHEQGLDEIPIKLENLNGSAAAQRDYNDAVGESHKGAGAIRKKSNEHLNAARQCESDDSEQDSSEKPEGTDG